MNDCPECTYEQRTGLPVPDGIVHHCDEQAQLDDRPHAPNGDPQDDDEEQEPDGRWVQAHGCWIYE